MGIYYFIISVILLECAIFNSSTRRQQSKKILFSLTIFFLAFVSGLRGMSVGHDTSNYGNIFRNIISLDFSTLLSSNSYSSMEQGYVWLCWLFGRFSKNYSHFLLFTSFFEFVSIGKWIWQNSQKPFLALLVFICMFFTFFLTGIRQCLALSILLFSYDDVKTRRIIPFCLKVVLASFFHQSALIFIGIYFLPLFFKDCSKTFWIFLLAMPLLFILRKPIFLFGVSLFARYSDYEVLNHGDAITYTLMLALIVFLSVFMLRAVPISIPSIKRDYCTYTNYIMVALAIMPFVGLNGSMMRVAMYYSLFICLLLEKLYGQFKNHKTRVVAVVVSLFALIFLFFNELAGSSYIYEFVGWENLI